MRLVHLRVDQRPWYTEVFVPRTLSHSIYTHLRVCAYICCFSLFMKPRMSTNELPKYIIYPLHHENEMFAWLFSLLKLFPFIALTALRISSTIANNHQRVFTVVSHSMFFSPSLFLPWFTLQLKMKKQNNHFNLRWPFPTYSELNGLYDV